MHAAPSLLELQSGFLGALYDEQKTGPADQVVGAGLAPTARLRIYRHSCEQIHLEALRTAYPAVLALVGEAFFEQAGVHFGHAHPSRSGNLQVFGEHFPEFLEGLPSTQSLPYLGDVARLEWRRQLAALANESEPLSLVEFEAAMAEAEGAVRVTFHPSAQRLVSSHPVLAIWKYAMQPAAERFTLPESGDRLVLWRSDGEVAMAVVDAASFACIDALAGGDTLDAAHAKANHQDRDFDLPTCIASLVTAGIVTAIRSVQSQESS